MSTPDYSGAGEYWRDNSYKLERIVLDRNKRIEELEREIKSLDESLEARDQKLEALASPLGKCACSYDHPDDVCMVHSPQLLKANKRIEKLEAALREFMADHGENWQHIVEKRIADIALGHSQPLETPGGNE